jgi:hypothetical protein
MHPAIFCFSSRSFSSSCFATTSSAVTGGMGRGAAVVTAPAVTLTTWWLDLVAAARF